MTSFAELAFFLAVTALPAAPAQPPPVPPAAAAQVAARIAQDWRVPAEALRLEWGRAPAGATVPATTPFRLEGRGADGCFVAVFDAPGSAVALRLRAGVVDSVPVAAHALGAGARLGPGDVRQDPRLHWGPPAADRRTVPGVGWEVRRALAAGEALSWPAVAAPTLVTGGQPVRLVWLRGALQVALTGVALNSARQGERVRARVEGRSTPLVGIATAPGTVELTSGGNP